MAKGMLFWHRPWGLHNKVPTEHSMWITAPRLHNFTLLFTQFSYLMFCPGEWGSDWRDHERYPVSPQLDVSPGQDKPQAGQQEEHPAGRWGRTIRGGQTIIIFYELVSEIFVKEEDVDVRITLRAVNPQRMENVVSFDFNKNQFEPLKLKTSELS